MKGSLIAFIGMDGAGKSTLVKALNERLKKEGKSSVIIYAGRGRGNLLPIQFFGRLYKKAGGKESNVPIQKDKFEKISVLHTLGTPIFALDMLLRYFFVIVPNLLNHDYVITDRYSTDILLMNKVPNGLKKFLFELFPKPSKIFYIYNSINILHKRKPEHPIEDLIRQEKIFRKIVKKTNATKLKNESINKSINTIRREMSS